MRIDNHVIESINANPLYRTIGIHLESAASGSAHSILKARPEACWPFENQPHGGILFTLMDTTMAWAIQSQLDRGFSCTTIDLGIRYMMPARGAEFHCRAETIHQTGRLSFVSADISNLQGHAIAAGQATFRIIKADIL